MGDFYIGTSKSTKLVDFVDKFNKKNNDTILSKQVKDVKPKKESYELGKGYIAIVTTCVVDKKKTMNKPLDNSKNNAIFIKIKGRNTFMAKGKCSECGNNKCNIISKDLVPKNLIANING